VFHHDSTVAEFLIVYNYDADLEVSDTCVRNSLVVELKFFGLPIDWCVLASVLLNFALLNRISETICSNTTEQVCSIFP